MLIEKEKNTETIVASWRGYLQVFLVKVGAVVTLLEHERFQEISASGLVVKSNVAIVGPPVRFRACAMFFPSPSMGTKIAKNKYEVIFLNLFTVYK